MIAIRQASDSDTDRIRSIFVSAIRELAKDHYSPPQIEAWSCGFAPEQIRERIRSGHIYVAELDGQVAGFAEIVPSTGAVEMVYTAPDFARKGIGSTLMEYIERLSRDAGAGFLHLRASMNAIPFYERMGFTVLERVIHCNAQGVEFDCAMMEKPLG